MRNIFVGTMFLMMAVACQNEAEKATEPVVAGESTKNPPPVEFADQKYIDMGKKAWSQFASGDIDGWATNFADNAIYRWSSGDSLAGKAAILKYWKDRRMKVIDSLVFTDDIWLPVTVNQPQGRENKGTWLLHWQKVNATYKNKARLTFWVHTDMHFNNENQIDEIIQYIDRAPINAALGRK
ncbi:nuclear transport factor 2 family protein [Longitalea luteola]|uniref:nuclear transport factor 2 family protein n=1 Tax=Longitalea luteola TaxID=2812563 RepID=UPI001A96E4EE|nr:nuclear transport factor 2 family protein [Longitalea luteola]